MEAVRVTNGSKLPSMPRLRVGNTRTARFRTGLKTAADAGRALRGDMKGQHLNYKTLEIGEFLVIVRHNVMLWLCTLNGDLG